MLTPQDLRTIRLVRRPAGQRALANLWVRPTWKLRGVNIEVHGLERLASTGPALLAMNHTDRYNYWGLQVALLDQHDQYTSTWVKGKYYEHWFSRWFMRSTSNIPGASRGYLIAAAFKRQHNRPPTADEYRQLRDLVDHPGSVQLTPELRDLLATDPLTWAAGIEDAFNALSSEVVRLTGEALAAGLLVLIFPEGTRAVRMGPGHIGIAQMAYHFRVPVIPVGCSGSPQVYPGDTPWPHRGTITYRVGDPLHPDAPSLAHHAVPPGFAPLTREAQATHGPDFQRFVDTLMERIEQLVDPAHRPLAGEAAPAGVDRFI